MDPRKEMREIEETIALFEIANAMHDTPGAFALATEVASRYDRLEAWLKEAGFVLEDDDGP